MSAADAIKANCWEDSGVTCMARVYGNVGTAITKASLTTITCKVFDLTDPSVTPSTPTVTISSAVSDALITNDPRWIADAIGYNFIFTIAASIITTGDHRYRAEFKFTPASGEVFWAAFILYAQPIMTS